MDTSPDGCFLVFLLTLNKYKKTNSKTPVTKTRYLCIFLFRPLPHVTALHLGFSDLWGSPPVLSSTPTFGFFCVWMLRHPVFQLTHMWLTGRCAMPEVTHINSLTCDLRGAMPRQRSPLLIPRETEDFPMSFNHSKHVPLPTYLAWLKSIYHNSGYVYIHVKTNLTCDEDNNKKT